MEQVQPHRDVDRERHVRCHERNRRSGEIDHKGYSKAPSDAVDGVSIDVGATQLTARDRRDQQIERTTAKDEREAIKGNRRTCIRTSEVGCEYRGGKWDERYVDECAAVCEQECVIRRGDNVAADNASAFLERPATNRYERVKRRRGWA